jgi:phthiocerol/phenolphthiocerol synthesis type-I polyketide synthase D
VTEPMPGAAAAAQTSARLRRWLIDYVAAQRSIHTGRVDTARPLQEYGFTSRDAVVLSGLLEELLDRPIQPTVLWRHPTIDKLVGHLAGQPDAQPAVATPPAPVPAQGGAGPAAPAVIGLGCRLPGGVASADEMWELLRRGGDAVGQVPADRWVAYGAASPEHAAIVAGVTPYGGFLDDVSGFDAAFFGIAPVEAAEMDPQQRILLEVAWEALEHAGIPPATLAGGRTGVFVGASSDDYGRRLLADLPGITGRSGTGAALSVIANRLSYLLDLRGPSMTVDTACSSSLVALHLARQSLVMGECDTAIVAGVNLLLSPAVTLNFDRAGAMSPTGRCRPFDAAADGYVRAEGCVALVLRRLADAERSGDRVLAVVRGSGVNQDGRSNGLMAPNPQAQEALLRSVYAAAGVPPTELGYVEAHGTGTPLGDPIEAGALAAALGEGRCAADPLLIGSVKSNLGHLEAGAGLAGAAKAVLALHNGMLPPTLHHSLPNPAAELDRLGLEVVTGLREWPRDRPAIAGVSSFGFGGTNAHAVLAAGSA